MYLRLSQLFVLFNKWISVYLILSVKKLSLNNVITLCPFTLYHYFTLHVSDSFSFCRFNVRIFTLEMFRYSVSVFSLHHFCFHSKQF